MAKNLVFGVGTNDADYGVTRNEWANGRGKQVWVCPFYLSWRAMLSRCYSRKAQERRCAYKGCSVCDEWLTFSNFKAWMDRKDWRGNHLDKDILVPGNKVYSPATCVFVSAALNVFLTDHRSAKGEWPVGVNWHGVTQKFVAQCSNPFTGKREHLGLFARPEEAHEAWRQRKHELACQYADMQPDPRIAEALRTRFAPQE